MTIHLVVGLPGAGKTTWAKELEARRSALRLTPDDWLFALFPDDGPSRWRSQERADQRDRLEGRLVETGMRAAQLGVEVVLDFGLWGRDERSALRWIAGTLGVRAEVVYLRVEPEEQRRRVAARFETRPGQFDMTDEDLSRWRAQFQEPDEAELRGAEIPGVLPGYATWSQWASVRWPSLPDRYGVTDPGLAAGRARAGHPTGPGRPTERGTPL